MKKTTIAGTLALAVCAATAGYVLTDRTEPQVPIAIEAAPVIYPTFADAQQANEATLVVDVRGFGDTVTDYGADGKPDFDGDPGLVLSTVDVHVVDVLTGDPGLKDSTITLTQFPTGINSEKGSEISLTEGSRYLILASRRSPNPSLSGEYWTTPLAGQGIFPVTHGHVTSPQGVFPETFAEPVSVSELT